MALRFFCILVFISFQLTAQSPRLLKKATKLIEKTYAVETNHELKIDSLTDRGATIVLTKDLSAFVPKKHMVKEDGSMLKKGDVVNFNVIECNSEYKRIVVSHLATYSKRKEIIKVKKEKVDKSTLGDLDVLVDLKKKMDDEI